MLPDIKKIRIIGLQLLIYFMSYRKTLPIYCGLLCLLIAACSPSSPSTITGQLETIEHTELFHTQVSTATPAPSASSTPEAIELSPTPHPSRTPEPTPEICPPLKDIPISNISKLVVNIYNPPKPGSDDAHQRDGHGRSVHRRQLVGRAPPRQFRLAVSHCPDDCKRRGVYPASCLSGVYRLRNSCIRRAGVYALPRGFVARHWIHHCYRPGISCYSFALDDVCDAAHVQR